MKRRSSPPRDTRNKVPRLEGLVEPVPKFLSNNANNFSQNFPFFREPREVGCFCLDESRQYHNDNHLLKFYRPPSNTKNLHLDLRLGYDTFIKQDDAGKISSPIDDLLRWIRDHPNKFLPPTITDAASPDARNRGKIFTDFICWRGLLTKLLCTPFEEREGWIVSVVKFHDTYYMCEYETQERIDERNNTSQRQEEMSYWGYKFEQYVVASKPHGQPENASTPVNSNPGYNVVVRSRLESHSLVFAGEVDCCDPDNPKTMVELKTSRLLTHPRQESSFMRFKLKKWWAQSFLVGIPKIICGFRDDDGIVRELKTYRTMEIPNMVRDKPNMWNAGICFNFLNAFLSFVKKVMVMDNSTRSPYVFRYKPKVSRDKVVWECHPPDSMYSFLPDWYVQDDAELADCSK
ncbi:decapping and exoribonuclease protein-like [Lineus longissimus]|uniref:decapping and exoribonuclease protein-like n=1 Tax=Lineus longissimus TaxID=88925 RepID=UPI00315D54A2